MKVSSKILLFGEYSIIYSPVALAIPYNKYSGKLTTSGSAEKKIPYTFIEYLLKHQRSFKNLSKLEKDVKKGLYFESNIPIGIGLGSSGALCASIYEGYLKETCDLITLKNKFSIMESFFHGKSSGFDPLVSYVGRPIFINNGINILNDFSFPSETTRFFLLRTMYPRKSSHLIALFKEKLRDKKFSGLIEKELLPSNLACINSFIEKDYKSLFENFATVSALQAEFFRPMIVRELIPFWGLKNTKLKLCGAGGGGVYLGISRDRSEIELLKSQFKLELL